MARIRTIKPDIFASRLVEPCDRPAGWGPVLLYRFYGADGALIYVGVTRRPAERWTAHRRTAPWWKGIAGLSTEMHPSMRKALAAELAVIAAEKPQHNKRGARK